MAKYRGNRTRPSGFRRNRSKRQLDRRIARIAQFLPVRSRVPKDPPPINLTPERVVTVRVMCVLNASSETNVLLFPAAGNWNAPVYLTIGADKVSKRPNAQIFSSTDIQKLFAWRLAGDSTLKSGWSYSVVKTAFWGPIGVDHSEIALEFHPQGVIGALSVHDVSTPIHRACACLSLPQRVWFQASTAMNTIFGVRFVRAGITSQVFEPWTDKVEMGVIDISIAGRPA